MKLELILIKNDMDLVHRSVSNVDDTVSPYTAAINAMVNELTGEVTLRAKVTPVSTNKFAEAVPNYVPPEVKHGLADEQFHPDLVKEGIAPSSKGVEKGIPTIKLDMKSILKEKK